LRLVLEGVTLGDIVAEMTELPEELTLHPGEKKTVQLPSSAGAGYVWEATVENEAVAEASMQFEQVDKAAVGRRTFSRTELLTLRGISPGTTCVRLVQRRTWEEDVEPIAADALTGSVAAGAGEATERGGKQ